MPKPSLPVAAGHRRNCHCRFCASIRVGDSGQRYEVQYTEKPEPGEPAPDVPEWKVMGWQAKPEGGLDAAARMRPGTADVRVVDRCKTWIEKDGGKELARFGPLHAFDVTARVEKEPDGCSYPWSLRYRGSGAIFGTGISEAEAMAEVIQVLEQQSIL